jgi:hypothetical protein
LSAAISLRKNFYICKLHLWTAFVLCRLTAILEWNFACIFPFRKIFQSHKKRSSKKKQDRAAAASQGNPHALELLKHD